MHISYVLIICAIKVDVNSIPSPSFEIMPLVLSDLYFNVTDYIINAADNRTLSGI